MSNLILRILSNRIGHKSRRNQSIDHLQFRRGLLLTKQGKRHVMLRLLQAYYNLKSPELNLQKIN